MFEFLFKYPRADYGRSDLVFTADLPVALLVVIAAVAILGIGGMLWRHRGRASAKQLAAVWALQVAIMAIVGAVLMQPALRTEQLKKGEMAVALVVDRSSLRLFG